MNCLSRLSSYTASIFGRTSHFIATTATNSHQSWIPFWRRSCVHPGLHLEFLSTRFRVQCYSSRKPSLKASVKKKKDPQPTTVMDHENDAFFVVRKGDVVGVYKNFADCQAQVGSSICDPPVSVYKGYSLSKDSEAYLVSHGLQNALYTVRAADLKEDLFGVLMPCPFQQPASSDAETLKNDTKKRSREVLGSEITDTAGSTSMMSKHANLDTQAECQAQNSNSRSCLLEFDGASKGNPGQAGAGAVLRTDDGSLICRLREGLGIATNNMAEYRAILLGMKYALQKGYTKIQVKGDSKLVCMQIQGSWKAKHVNITNLCTEAKKLKNSFLSFHISHVLRKDVCYAMLAPSE
ncbi:uncharacterized protein LOC7462616 isoform X2 [Populus trichocarpa]|uniref:uncharacterized protein LOC7462616 isoform X2 n=1 Tax=Populus trichocarpa TaxID=3694 RepID=UPI0022775CE7|nr:uncharacterized protein LOC7462616 isoform X2 [Populus trichocarpa]